ncbi:MAG: DUF2892 domain-containing protein [Candidatus Zixiibacteriota bacterium]|nr:MAG: DUF2892 domain-containing protein [candidate division Zixibacteria bacterium]
MGCLEGTVRFNVGMTPIPVGLFLLDGWQGNLIGAPRVVAVLALAPVVVSVTGICPGYSLVGISNLGRK